MPEPITALVVAKTMAKGAIAKVGGKILEAVAPGVFSNEKDFEEIKEQLSKISEQLDEVLSIARNTFDLVEQLPNIVADLIDEQTLFLARTKIESSIQVYLSLNAKPNTISHGELTDLVQSWNILIDKEKKTWVINQLPRYGEYLLSATDGKLYSAVLSGVNNKKTTINSAHEAISDRITSLTQEAEGLFSGRYVKSGSFEKDEPWLTWKPEGNRSKKETRCISRPNPLINGDVTFCWDEQVPDIAWNNELARVKSRLSEIRIELEEISHKYRSLIVSDRVLTEFNESLVNRKDSIIPKTSELKVVDNNQPFSVKE